MASKKDGTTAVSIVKAGVVAECRLLKLDDLCQHMNVSIAQLQKLRRAGKVLPSTTTLGRSPRWLDLEFFDWLRAGCPAAIFWKWEGRKRDGR